AGQMAGHVTRKQPGVAIVAATRPEADIDGHCLAGEARLCCSVIRNGRKERQRQYQRTDFACTHRSVSSCQTFRKRCRIRPGSERVASLLANLEQAVTSARTPAG